MNKQIVITGANKGIGLATVKAILSAGDDTSVWLGSRDASRGEAARAEILGENPVWADRVTVLEIDVGRDTSVERAVDRVIGSIEEGSLYGVVNNAGIYSGLLQTIFNVNTLGPWRVTKGFLPHLQEGGRIVNISSAAGPMFVATCSEERKKAMTNPKVSWPDIKALMAESLAIDRRAGDFAEEGLGDGAHYGLSKALLNAYTIATARRNKSLLVNACTPGFIETDLTRPFAESQGKTPEQMGMKSAADGTRATMHLLFGDLLSSGWYFGSDAVRSPLDRYRAPGDPAYDGS